MLTCLLSPHHAPTLLAYHQRSHCPLSRPVRFATASHSRSPSPILTSPRLAPFPPGSPPLRTLNTRQQRRSRSRSRSPRRNGSRSRDTARRPSHSHSGRREDDLYRPTRDRSRSRSKERSKDHDRERDRERDRDRSRRREERGDRDREPRRRWGSMSGAAAPPVWGSESGPMNAPPAEADAHARVSRRENRLYVGNLKYEVTYKDLRNFMSAGESRCEREI